MEQFWVEEVPHVHLSRFGVNPKLYRPFDY